MPHTPLNSKEDMDKALATKGKYVLIYGYENEPSKYAEEMADKFAATTDAYAVDIAKHPIVKERFNITATPAILVYKDGEKVKEMFGTNEQARQELIDLLS